MMKRRIRMKMSRRRMLREVDRREKESEKENE